MKSRYDLKEFMVWAMHTLKVGSFNLDSAFEVLRIWRRFVMPKIEFSMRAKRFSDAGGLNWCQSTKLIFYEPMRRGFERTSSYYLTPEVADLKLDGKPLPDHFELTPRRVRTIFPRLEMSAFLLYEAMERGQVTLRQALDVIGDRAVYELRLLEYMENLRGVSNWDKDKLRREHKALVDTALVSGKKVPDAVLSDHYRMKGVNVRVPPKMAQASLFDVLRLN